MPSTPGAVGPDGHASLTIALPISPGRGYAPSLALQYHSGAGNGLWGSGWQCNVPCIRRRTDRGVPLYTDNDTFVGIDGEVLVAECDAQSNIVRTQTNTYGAQTLDRTYEVTRYWCRVEATFARIERWQAEGVADFWVIHNPTGEVLCLGKSAQARIADPDAAQTRIVCWMAEESVSPTGEHIYYRYSSAAEVGVTDTKGRDIYSQRVLTSIHYGNLSPAADLWLWTSDSAPATQRWLFTLVMDYGVRGTDSSVPPPFNAPEKTPWPVRQDAFSTYDAGFEVRTHFLCRQALMFHHFPDELGEPDTLVSRLLLSYDENPYLSHLVGAQSLAYEPDTVHTLQSLPPLELGYSVFSPRTEQSAWQPLHLPAEFGQAACRLVDLYGEGLPGLLYQQASTWHYRAPQRDTRAEAGADAVTFGELTALPMAPSVQAGEAVRLVDINGDGRLEWLVTQADGMVGYYTLRADRQWSAFTELATFPLEYLHASASFADLRGAGLPDLAMVGPRSVRLYINDRAGFGAAQTVAHDGDHGLPVFGSDRQEMVAFCDMLGSGQSHLVSVRHDRVQCWPNRGNGRFGTALTLADNLPFDAALFDPRRVYLADLDGSGACDLLYAGPEGIQLFFNQAGNALSAAITVPYPTGVSLDQLSQLQIVDLASQGTATLVLSCLGPSPTCQLQHWRYDVCAAKPYLLNCVDNNCGASTHLTYRSSAQEWLDEKSATPTALAGVPFPLWVLSHTEHHDSVSDTHLINTYQYRRGYWDGHERQWRGFGYVETRQFTNQGANFEVIPLRSCRWYHTGRADDDTALFGTPYEDPDAFPVKATRLTQWQGTADDGLDMPFDPDANTAWWMHRALKGTLLREELYGPQASAAATNALSVNTTRAQVRLIQPGAMPVVAALSIGTTTYRYEEVANDPQIAQSVALHYDGYGQALWNVAIAYPRRLTEHSANPYSTPALPAAAWAATFDPQQTLLRLTESRLQVLNHAQAQAWVLGVPVASRTNVLTYSADHCPREGLSLEALSAATGLLGVAQPREMTGQRRHHYVQDPALPSTLMLLDHTETALLNADDLDVYQPVVNPSQQAQLLKDGGYHAMAALLPTPGAAAEPDTWAAATGFTTYLGADCFWRAQARTAAQLPAADGRLPTLSVAWDRYHCCQLSSTDAYANTVSAAIDYRFLAPWQVTDINANQHEIQRDALGRLIATSTYGTELGADGLTPVNVGFSPLASTPAPVGQTVAAAVAVAMAINQGTGQQAQATRVVYDAFSQMGQVSLAQLQKVVADPAAAQALFKHLQTLRFVTPQGHVLARAWRWVQSSDVIAGVPAGLRALLQSLPRQPVHSATLSADAYPGQAQQIAVKISHHDGAGCALQTATLAPDGPAFQRTNSGALAVLAEKAVEAAAHPRWAVTERVAYNGRGEAALRFKPYFVDAWQYVNAAAVQACWWADTHYYDASGRETRVVTANGWVRRQTYTPWFTINEDENDTAGEQAIAAPAVESSHG